MTGYIALTELNTILYIISIRQMSRLMLRMRQVLSNTFLIVNKSHEKTNSVLIGLLILYNFNSLSALAHLFLLKM